MNWNGYTVFSVLSGLVLLIGALVARSLSAKERSYGLIGGAFFIGYGVFVAGQTSGTYLFPIWIFILPVGAIVYLVVAATGMFRDVSRPAKAAPGAEAGQASDDVSATPSLSGVVPDSSSPQARLLRPAVWTEPPPPPSSGHSSTDA